MEHTTGRYKILFRSNIRETWPFEVHPESKHLTHGSKGWPAKYDVVEPKVCT